MLHFQYSGSGTKTVAQWIDERYSETEVKYLFTSSFSGQRTTLDATVTSNTSKDILGGWLLLQNDNNQLPSASGQYTLNIHKVTRPTENPEWIYATDSWIQEDERWTSYSGSGVIIGDLLTTNRAFVSGSDFDPIYKYSYQDEPIYSVYDG